MRHFAGAAERYRGIGGVEVSFCHEAWRVGDGDECGRGRCVWDEMAERGLGLAGSEERGGGGGDVVARRPGKVRALDKGLLVPRLHLMLGRNHIAPGEGRDGFVVGRKKMTFVRTSFPSGGVKEEAVANQKRKCADEGGCLLKVCSRGKGRP